MKLQPSTGHSLYLTRFAENKEEGEGKQLTVSLKLTIMHYIICISVFNSYKKLGNLLSFAFSGEQQ